MRREPDFFGEGELELVFVAKRLGEALKMEEFFNASGIDYLVETATYLGGFLFKRELTGAFFYVPPQMLEQVTELMVSHGYKVYES
jgi:hypothetical protein